MKRAKSLVSAAEHSIGSKEAPEAGRMELRNLLKDMDVYASRVKELIGMLEGYYSQLILPHSKQGGNQRMIPPT